MSEQDGDLYAPQRWGLPAKVIADLGDRLQRFWSRFRGCFKTQTRDSAAHAWAYLRGLLGLDSGRNFANIARRVNGPEDDGQDVQHFMSDSPWSAAAVIQQVQAEIAAIPELGWRMIQRVQDHGLPFEAIACDDLYGRSGWLRQQMAEAGLLYIGRSTRNYASLSAPA